MSDGQNLYNGHKVVAMPNVALGAMSHHERKSSHKADDASSVSSYHSRARSRSSGRGGSVSRSRDIVQDVYDRMGVNYVRGRPSIESFLKDNGVGDIQHAKKSATKSSLQANSRLSEFGTSSTISTGNFASDTCIGVPPRPTHRGRLSTQWPPVAPTSSKDNEEVGSNYGQAGLSGLSHKARNDRRNMPSSSARPTLQPSYGADQRDEELAGSEVNAPEDEREGMSVVSATSNKSSIRERIGIFGGSSVKPTIGPRGNARHSYGGAGRSTQRSYPPKVNIYDSANANYEGPNDGVEYSVEVSNAIDQSSCIGGNRRHSTANSVSQRSVADAFLTAISGGNDNNYQGSTSPQAISRNIAVVEIPSNDMQGNDAASVAASSVSGEDFGTGSPKRRFGGKPPSFVKNTASNTNNSSTEKQVEERVQSQIAVVARKFEAEIRRIENRIEQECKARIEELETKNQQFMALLSYGDGRM